MFLPKKKGDVFFPARKAADERWGVVITPCSILSRITIIIDRIMTKAGLIRDSPVIRIVFI
jgi:hypothetical protein